jgi:hypothetical protein
MLFLCRFESRLEGPSEIHGAGERNGPSCDILVHLGDVKPPDMACNKTLLTKAVNYMMIASKRHGKIALYAPGDNEQRTE